MSRSKRVEAHAKSSPFTEREFQRLLRTAKLASDSVKEGRVYSELRHLVVKDLADRLIARRKGSSIELDDVAETLMRFAQAEHGWWCDGTRVFRSWYQEWQHDSLARTGELEKRLARAERLEDSVGLVCAAAGVVEALVDICHAGAYEGREDGSAEECVRIALITCHMALDAPRCDAIMRAVTRLLLDDPRVFDALELIASHAGTNAADLANGMSLQGRLLLALTCGLLWGWDEEWVRKEEERLGDALRIDGAGRWAFDVTRLSRPYEGHVGLTTFARRGLAELGIDGEKCRAVVSALRIPETGATIVTIDVAVALMCAMGIAADTRLTLLAYYCFRSALTDAGDFVPAETLCLYLPE